MKVTQIYELVNVATKETLGETAVLNEDLSNLVDIGDAIETARGYDNYVRALADHIGKVVMVNRIYRGSAPSVLMDGWEFGSIMEKISCDLPEATENESWELQNGTSYDPNIFYAPKVLAKFFNGRVTFEIPISRTEKQVKSAFSSVEQMDAFLSMIINEVAKAMTVKLDDLVMKTINSMTAMTIYNEYQGGSLTAKSTVKAVNLLKLYNDTMTGTTGFKALTTKTALTNPDFLRFASATMWKVKGRMAKMSRLFNMGGAARFTDDAALHVVMHNDFVINADMYLQSNTFHDTYTALPNHSSVPCWQGSGKTYGFEETSKIDVKTPDNQTVQASGILAVMFDRDALGVANMDRRVTSQYNAKAEFWTEFHKMDAGYFNDQNENFVVFFIA